MSLSKKEIEGIVLQYNLGKLKNFKKIKEGFVNLNFKVRTDKGDFFLREYTRVVRMHKLEYTSRTIMKLWKKDFPVAKPIPLKTGKFIFEKNKRKFSMAEFIEGKKYDFSKVELINSAKILARLHNTNIGRPSRDSTIVKIWKEDLYLKNKLWADKNSVLNQLLNKSKKTKLEFFIIDSITKIAENYNLLIKDLPKIRKRKLSLIHGDFWWGQLIFKEKKVAAVVDFDDIKFGIAEHDLVMLNPSSGSVRKLALILRNYQFFLKVTKKSTENQIYFQAR